MSEFFWNLAPAAFAILVVVGIGAFLYYNLDKPPLGSCIHRRDRYWCDICNPEHQRKGDRGRP